MKRLQFVRWAINFSWLMRWAEFKNCIENIDANECVCVCTSARILHMCVSLHNKNDALRTWLNIARAHREHRLLIHLANDVCVCACVRCACFENLLRFVMFIAHSLWRSICSWFPFILTWFFCCYRCPFARSNVSFVVETTQRAAQMLTLILMSHLALICLFGWYFDL